jgi:putative ABC transport system permease protein
VLKLAFRNIVRQRARAGLTLAAIALGVASLVLSGGFVADILRQLRETTIHSQLGHLQIYRQGQFASGGHHPLDFLFDNSDAVARELASLPGVLVYGRRINFPGLISNGHAELPIIGEGVETGPEARIGSAFSIQAGRQLAMDPFGMVVGEGLAQSMKLAVGDSVNLVSSTREGAANALDFTIVGIFRSLSKDYDARAVRVPLAAAQELVGATGANAFVLLLERTEQTDAMRVELERRLPPGLEVKTWQDLADFYKNTAALYEREFGFLQAIILVMVILSVANSMNMTLHERIPEFGIMRALGQRGRDVFRLALVEAASLGTLGSLVGVAVGVVVALAVSAVGIPMSPPPNSESGFNAGIQVVPSVLAAAFSMGLLASVCGSLWPARHLSRIPLAEALRRAV